MPNLKFLMARSTEFEIISSLTRPGASIEAAIRDILLLTSEAALAESDTIHNHNGPLSIHLNDVWSSLVEKVVATTVAAQQGALVEFLRVLRRQEVNDPATGEQILYALVPDYTVPVWTGLPLFGISVRDEWNFDADSCTPEEESCYYNKLAFLAQLTNLPENHVEDRETTPPPYDFSLYALWDFRNVFEEDPKSDKARTILLRAASLWMIYCAEKLWADSRADRSYVHKASGTNPAKAGEHFESDKQWTGFNKERWTIWVEGLRRSQRSEAEDVKELVAKALIEVERVENSA